MSLMNFFAHDLYDSLQMKSCFCKSPYQKFVFIKTIFDVETSQVKSIDELRDNCPLLHKLIRSLFENIRVYDFLRLFLKKVLKKDYMKKIISQQYDKEIQRRHTWKVEAGSKCSSAFKSEHLLPNNAPTNPTINSQNTKPKRVIKNLLQNQRKQKQSKYTPIINRVFLKSVHESFTLQNQNLSSNSSLLFSKKKDSYLDDQNFFCSDVFGKLHKALPLTENPTYFGPISSCKRAKTN